MVVSALEIRTFLESPLFVNVATAGIIISAGIVIAHFASSAVGLLIQKAGWKDKFMKYGIKNPSAFFDAISKYVILLVAFVLALRRLGLFEFVFSIIAAVIIGLVIIASYLEFRDAVANLIAFLYMRRLKLQKGEKIRISGLEGRVTAVGYFEVALLSGKEDTVIIPNRFFLKSKLYREAETQKL